MSVYPAHKVLSINIPTNWHTDIFMKSLKKYNASFDCKN